MKLRNLFSLLLVTTLVFAACEKGAEDTDKTPEQPDTEQPGNDQPGEEVKDPVLTLTSEATMEFTAEGGAGEITYTLQNAVEGTTLTATCEAAWVTDLTAGETVTFTVAANDGDAREANVVVAYGEQSFEVTVKQAKKEQGEEPDDPETVNFEAKYLVGEYFTDGDVGFYYLMFYDVEEEGIPAENATLYSISLFDEKYDGEWSELIPLPTGEFTFDATDSGEVGTFGCEDGGYIAAGMEAMLPFEDGDFVVDESGVTLSVTIDGVKHVVTLDGEPAIYNTDEPETPVVPGEPTQFTPVKVTASHSNMEAGNFVLNLYFNDSKFHEFDMYDETAPNDNYLSPGTYTTEDGTIGTEWSRYNDGAKKMNIESAELTLTLNQDDWTFTIVGEFSSVEGHAHTINWTGAIEGFVDPNAPEEFPFSTVEGETVRASTTDGSTWTLVFFEDNEYMGNPMTRIVVSLAETNTLHITDGTYRLADGTIVANTGGTDNSFYRYSREADGGAMTECELTVTIDKENETAKLAGYFVAAAKTITFEWNGAVDGFRYKESTGGAIDEWKSFKLASQSSHNCYNEETEKYDKIWYGYACIEAESIDGDTFTFYIFNTINPPAKGDLAPGTYPVAGWNVMEKICQLGDDSKVNDHSGLAEGGQLVIENNDGVYTITFNITDTFSNTNWVGSWTGTFATL